jgi:hypothetical protein
MANLKDDLYRWRAELEQLAEVLALQGEDPARRSQVRDRLLFLSDEVWTRFLAVSARESDQEADWRAPGPAKCGAI